MSVQTSELGKTSLFQGLPESVLATLCQSMKRVELPKGQVVMEQGHACNKLYVLSDGAVKISIRNSDGGQTLIGVLGPRNVLGELGMVDGVAPPVRVTALHPCTFLCMGVEDFRECARKIPLLYLNGWQIADRRLRRLLCRYEVASTRGVPGLLAYGLMLLAEECGTLLADGSIFIRIKFTQSELATLCGASRNWVSQKLSSFVDEELISVDAHGYITILNRRGLEALYHEQ